MYSSEKASGRGEEGGCEAGLKSIAQAHATGVRFAAAAALTGTTRLNDG